MDRINCKRCIHYYVTWDRHAPHGCRAFGFKSRQIPSMVVQKSSQKPCTHYRPKTKPASEGH
ncbi:MAG TPA: uracil-DNA glycosylase [Epsilonproteobacteria bacterium]|nr:uracil-DNA glycosylase [Campylobacterota bacterium]